MRENFCARRLEQFLYRCSAMYEKCHPEQSEGPALPGAVTLLRETSRSFVATLLRMTRS